MSLSQNSKQQKSLIKATTETGCQDQPNSDTRQDAKHWNITKTINFFFLSSNTTKIPSHIYTESMLKKDPFTSVQQPRWTCYMVPKVPVFNCAPPPMSKLAQVNKAMVTLANCKWSTVPQIVYYRLKAWIVVSTLPRASNMSLEKYLQQNICTPLCFRTTLIAYAAPPEKGRDSVKLTALSTVIPETPRTKRELNF